MTSSRILVATHANPDGDAIGSLIAMGMAMEALGKETVMLNVSPIPAVYRFLPSVERISKRLPAGARFDTAVILDCSDLPRIGEDCAAVEKIPVKINIDHHVTNTRFGDLTLIDPEACATAEIVHRIIRAMDIPFDLAMATGIYTGILTDTGSFRFSNTNRAAFAVCEEMTALGVNPYDVAKHVFGTYSLGRIKLLNLAIDSIELSRNGRISMMTLTRDMLKKTGTHTEDVDGLINYAKRIEYVKVAVLIQEGENGRPDGGQGPEYHVSLRSDGSVDVSDIAASFGGGGHFNAAGFSVNTSLAELKRQIFDLAEFI